jgi:hypothetical protein
MSRGTYIFVIILFLLQVAIAAAIISLARGVWRLAELVEDWLLGFEEEGDEEEGKEKEMGEDEKDGKVNKME